MSLDNCEVVDAIGTEDHSNTVVLSIIDSWDWRDEQRHLIALQEKLNAYFAFIESEQVHASYPNALGKTLRIDIVGRHPLPAACLALLQKASAVAAQLGVAVAHRMHEGGV